LKKNIKLLLVVLFGLGIAGCAQPARAKDVAINDANAGQKLYVAKCAKCHKFYDPAKYSEADWQMWMAKMSKKAKLKPEQQEEVSRYIAEYLRHGGATTNNASITK
jgi:mono/diheme cytochrome c family protein